MNTLIYCKYCKFYKAPESCEAGYTPDDCHYPANKKFKTEILKGRSPTHSKPGTPDKTFTTMYFIKRPREINGANNCSWYHAKYISGPKRIVVFIVAIIILFVLIGL